MTFLRTTALALGGIAAAAVAPVAVAAPSASSVTLSGLFDIGVYRGFDGSKQVGPFRANRRPA